MKGLAYAATAAILLLAQPAVAAELTRTATGFEDNASFPLGIDLQVSYERIQHRALINRENHQTSADGPDIFDVAELRFSEVKQVLPIRLAIGIWHDLELHASLPIVLS